MESWGREVLSLRGGAPWITMDGRERSCGVEVVWCVECSVWYEVCGGLVCGVVIWWCVVCGVWRSELWREVCVWYACCVVLVVGCGCEVGDAFLAEVLC